MLKSIHLVECNPGAEEVPVDLGSATHEGGVTRVGHNVKRGQARSGQNITVTIT